MLIEQLYNYKHRLSKTHPLVKSLYVLPAFVLAIISEEFMFHLCVFFLFFIGILIVAKISFIKLLKLFSIPAIFILMGCLTLLFSFESTGLEEQMIPLTIGIDKTTYPIAISILFKSFAIVSVVYFWLLTNTISQIAAIMYACRIPQLFVEIFVLTYKFIFMLTSTTKSMLIAQKCRMGYSSVRKNSIDNFATLFGAVFKQAMHQTEQIEIAMDSRIGNNEYLFVRSKQDFVFRSIIKPVTVGFFLFSLFIVSEL